MTVVTVAPAFAAPDPPTNGGNGAGQNGQFTGSPDPRSGLLINFGMRYGQSGLLHARSHDLLEKNPTEVAIVERGGVRALDLTLPLVFLLHRSANKPRPQKQRHILQILLQ